MKKLWILLISLVLITCGCNKNENNYLDSPITKGNCSVFDCIKKIEPTNTVSEVNEIIGFEGELTNAEYNIYYWELSDNTGIEIAFYSGSYGTIKAKYDYEMLTNSNVDFSRYNDLQDRIREGITYSEFITYIGNVEGTVTEKSNYSTKYTWVDRDGKYLTASFSNSTNKCSIASGRL